ncbi:MAG: hypothetical protein D3923_04645 [Candidatus Electrothrix sp. AR3]|nr:hypothetical protein [Candidatus Electrothrix sp. AR3]
MKTLFWPGVTIILVFSFFCGGASSKELLIAFPANLPPWTLQGHDSGITVEIVRQALRLRGHQLKTKYLPLKQLNQTLDADAHAQVESLYMRGYFSTKITEFHTSLISLKPRAVRVHSVEDLKDKKIITFENASALFGPAFQEMSQANPDYQEIVNQELQVVQLYNGQTDLILIDRNTFLYFRQITAMTNTSMPITYHQILGLTERSSTFVVFKDEKLRDDFNIGLQELKENGAYYDIFYTYTR